MKLKTTLFFFILILFLSSCNWFDDNPSIHIQVDPCSPPPLNIQTGEISQEKAFVRYLVTNINGDTIKKWILIPQSPGDVIYEACNLPDTVKKDWIKVDFHAYEVTPNINHPHDTILHGITHIQLTELQVKENEID